MTENWNQNPKAKGLPKSKRNITNHECFASEKAKERRGVWRQYKF